MLHSPNIALIPGECSSDEFLIEIKPVYRKMNEKKAGLNSLLRVKIRFFKSQA
jgi:hypothetical protein